MDQLAAAIMKNRSVFFLTIKKYVNEHKTGISTAFLQSKIIMFVNFYNFLFASSTTIF